MIIFKNKYGEVRSGWKIALILLLMFLLMNIMSIIVGIAVGIYTAIKGVGLDSVYIYELEDSPLIFLTSIMLQNIALVASVMIIWKAFEKKKISFMGLISLKKGYSEFGAGLLLGAAAITIVGTTLILLGQVELVNPLSAPNFSYDLLIGLAAFIAVGFGEEIFGRAYCMTVLKQTRNKYAVLGISAAIFAAMHLGNNGISAVALINLFLMGVLFGYMFMKSGNVWMPIGFHITWNYFQGYILGFEVSGNAVQGIYQLHNTGSSFINGGAFGPEGGIIVTAIIIFGFFVIGRYYNDKNIDDFIGDKIISSDVR